MPLLRDQTFPVWPSSCDDDPPAKRPTFTARGLTTDEQLKAAAVADAIDTSKSRAFEDNVDALFNVLTMCITGVSNVNIRGDKNPQPTKSNLQALLSPREADDLLTRIMLRQVPNAEEKKTSPSRSRGAAATSRKRRAKKRRST